MAEKDVAKILGHHRRFHLSNQVKTYLFAKKVIFIIKESTKRQRRDFLHYLFSDNCPHLCCYHPNFSVAVHSGLLHKYIDLGNLPEISN